MSEKQSSQPQQSAPSFDPIALWSQWTQDHIARVQAYCDELAGLEAKAYERAKAASQQMAVLANESLAYCEKLAAEWREMTLQATRRGTDFFRPKA
jgi:hypothetical protein